MPVAITWSLKGKELNSGPSIATTQLGQRASILVISSVDYTHIGKYTCRATNPAGSVTHSTDLKVNGNGQVTWECTGNICIMFTFLIFRTTCYCSLLLRFGRGEHRRLFSTPLRRISRGHAGNHNMEPEGPRAELGSGADHDDAGDKDQHADNIICQLPAYWGVHMQGNKPSRLGDTLCRTKSQWLAIVIREGTEIVCDFNFICFRTSCHCSILLRISGCGHRSLRTTVLRHF